MNKKAGLFGFFGFFGFIVICFIIYIAYISMAPSENYKAYNDFCKERPDFCYCKGLISCEFRTSQTCVNSKCDFSKDTKDLCKLAESLKDKEVIFKVGC